MNVELTEDERRVWSSELPTFFKDDVIDPEFELDTYGIAIAEAAQLKLMQWLHEPCCKHDAGILRLGCPECWRELRKEVGL